MIRSATTDDYGYIVKSWVRSYSRSAFALASGPASEAKLFEDDGGVCHWSAGSTYQNGHHDLVNRLVRTCTTVIYDAGDGIIDAFACGERGMGVIHYVFVRESERGKGYAKALVGHLLNGWSANVTYSHQTPELRLERLPAGWNYSAYPLFRRAAYPMFRGAA